MKKLALAILITLTTTSAFAGGWATIVYQTKTGQWAAARGADTRELAEETALKYCPDCAGTSVAQLQENTRTKTGLVRETYGRNGWLALAVGKGNTRWGTGGLQGDRVTAEAKAIQNCGGAAQNCYVVRSLSAYDNGAGEDGVVPPPAEAAAPMVQQKP